MKNLSVNGAWICDKAKVGDILKHNTGICKVTRITRTKLVTKDYRGRDKYLEGGFGILTPKPMKAYKGCIVDTVVGLGVMVTDQWALVDNHLITGGLTVYSVATSFPLLGDTVIAPKVGKTHIVGIADQGVTTKNEHGEQVWPLHYLTGKLVKA